MDVICFAKCLITPVNVVLSGITLIALLAAITAYKLSRSYKNRVLSLYVAMGLIPLTLVIMLGSFNCETWTSCIPHIMGLVSKGLLASTFGIGAAYYLGGSYICVKALRGKRMQRELFPEVYEILDDVCHSLDIKTPTLYYIESGRPKALSISGSKNIIALSVGTFELLSRSELKAVLAHEVAHLKNKHPWIKFISRFLGFSYVYGFGFSKDLELEQERYANEVARKVVDKKALSGAIDKFKG